VDLGKAIGKALGRPSFMSAPAFMIKLVLGEFGSVILEGQRAVPKVLLDNGFQFEFPTIDGALKDLL
jgi:NAD dependent epimerase/dehydratase family enzyme